MTVEIWFDAKGHRPGKTDEYRQAAAAADASGDTPAFDVVGVTHGGNPDGGPDRRGQFALRVDLPGASAMSSNSLNGLITTMENRWGGTVEHVETVQR